MSQNRPTIVCLTPTTRNFVGGSQACFWTISVAAFTSATLTDSLFAFLADAAEWAPRFLLQRRSHSRTLGLS